MDRDRFRLFSNFMCSRRNSMCVVASATTPMHQEQQQMNNEKSEWMNEKKRNGTKVWRKAIYIFLAYQHTQESASSYAQAQASQQTKIVLSVTTQLSVYKFYAQQYNLRGCACVQWMHVDNFAFSMQFDDFVFQYACIAYIVHCVWWRTGYKNDTQGANNHSSSIALILTQLQTAPSYWHCYCHYFSWASASVCICFLPLAHLLFRSFIIAVCVCVRTLFWRFHTHNNSWCSPFTARLILLTWTHCIEWWSVRSKKPYIPMCSVVCAFDSSYLWTRSWRALPRTLPSK